MIGFKNNTAMPQLNCCAMSKRKYNIYSNIYSITTLWCYGLYVALTSEVVTLNFQIDFHPVLWF